MQMIDSGHLNAIVFWFDLHLDEDISITSAPACIGLGGELLADVEGGACSTSGREPQQRNPVKARGKSTLQSLGRPQEAPLHPPCSYTAGDGHAGNFSPARVSSMACLHFVCMPWRPEHVSSPGQAWKWPRRGLNMAEEGVLTGSGV